MVDKQRIEEARRKQDTAKSNIENQRAGPCPRNWAPRSPRVDGEEEVEEEE
jgi:hypothetical protein